MTTMPVDKGFYVTSGFGPRWGTVHYGTDFGRDGGSGGHPIYAVKDGTVTAAGPASGFGQWINVDHPASVGGGLTVYGHIIPEVRVGQAVREGQRIGRINPDSRTNGGVAPHLHLEWHRYVWSPPGPDRLDPMPLLAGARWPGTPAPAPAPSPPKESTVKVLDWHDRFHFGQHRPTSEIKTICIHVTVNAPGTPAENVANYQIRSESGSYHELVDTRPVVLIENTPDWMTWSAGPTANWRGLHRSFVMRGNETVAQWLAQEAMLRAAAERDAAWATRYGIPVRKITAAQLRAGEKGFHGHHDASLAWGESDHVDPGPGFPWDHYLNLVRQYQAGGVPTPPARGDELDMASLDDVRRIVREEVAAVTHDTKRVCVQMGMDADDDGFGRVPGWEQGGHRSFYDLLSALAAKAGVSRTKDTLPDDGPANARNPKLRG